ncbi:hypothetical protein H2199_004778 [Coniosporium tulheliwenetii]|uniref:Uncharacterized protein n=1 Tax=Coniosporium tulheliwenetii TaxID=3383036 RepID=A0ACC2Z412_9PEZI|nr:hypothetical protein H2199_004778 [Cladosporium sp. JES 115]
MESIKDAAKSVTGSGSSDKPGQFESGHTVPVFHQKPPGLQSEMKGPEPLSDRIPTPDGGSQLYKAAGKLEGRKALITGGDSGIGRAIAILFAMEGADSFIVYLPEEEKDAQETKKKVEEYGRKCYLHATDLTAKENCKAVVEAALEKLGSINILVNNAAFQMMKQDIKDLPEEQWIKTFNTNIHPYFYLAKYTLPHMKKGDTIINNASINAYIGRPDLLDYTSTKASRGIRVNAVAPGPVWTPLIPSTMTDEAMKEFTSPMGRPSQPSEIATCFVFLASMDSSSISGQTLHPNGGTIVNG